MRPDDPRHGKLTGYSRGGCREACCRRAIRLYNQQRLLRQFKGEHTGLVDANGTVLRIRALVRLGWAFSTLDARAGYQSQQVSHLAHGAHTEIWQSTWKRIAKLYDNLSMTFPPETDRWERMSATRARNYAKKNGWLPPLALDDELLDTPGYVPGTHLSAVEPAYDEVAVLRVLDGDRSVRLNTTERREAVRRLHALYLSDAAMADRVGCDPLTVLRIRQRLGLPANVDPGRNITRRAS